VATIRLREVIASDLPILYEYQREPEANDMAAFPPRDHDAFMAHWAKIMADPTLVLQTILADETIAGSIGSWPKDGKRLIGYWIGKEHWGKGIASAALAVLVKEMTERPLHAFVAKRNLASIRVLQKCGFTISMELTESAPEDGVEEWLYQLT
jgi:RimJ/RimL family protein N-acetyltransferase